MTEELLWKELEKEYGGVVFDASFIKEQKRRVVPMAPNLDMGTGGGLCTGTWNIFSGQEKSGKTTLALQVCANAQRLYDMPVVYLDIEGRLKELNLHSIDELELDNGKLFKIIKSSKDKILTAEDYLQIGTKVLRTLPGCILVLDSASAICSEKEMTDPITGQTRSLGPKLLATFCRQMGGVVPVQDSMVIIIQHLITNTSGYGAKYLEDGGTKIKYQGDTKLRCKRFEEWKEEGEIVGQKCEWQVIFSALGPPGAKLDSWIRYGVGIDKIKEVLETGIQLALIEKKGSWIQIDDEKMQGVDKAYAYLQNHPDTVDRIYKEILGVT